MAESILKSIASAKKLNWKIDSAAVREWNVGRPPEPRCLKVLKENGLGSNHVGRTVGILCFF